MENKKWHEKRVFTTFILEELNLLNSLGVKPNEIHIVPIETSGWGGGSSRANTTEVKIFYYQ